MLLFDWTVHKAITYNEQLKMKRDANWKQSFYITALEALELKKNGIFIMTLNRISLLTFPHSAVCKNDTMKLFNQPPVVLSYRPRHCCGIRPRLWAVSIVSNKKKLEKFNFFQVGSNCSHSTNIFATFWCLSGRFGDFRSSLSQTSLG